MDYQIKLRNFTEKDVPLMRRWLNLPHVLRWYKTPKEWLDEIDKRIDEFSFITHLIVIADDTPIGFCQYYPVIKAGEKWYGDIELDNTYSIDYLIGDAKYLRKGLAPVIISLLNQKIFHETDAKRIIVKPDEENLRSRKALARADYQYDFDNQLFIINKKD